MTVAETRARRLLKRPDAVFRIIKEAAGLLSDDYRPLFLKLRRKELVFDLEREVFYIRRGGYALVWRIRRRPGEPVSETNQQTSRGYIALAHEHPCAKEN